jgi:hypothetical protein
MVIFALITIYFGNKKIDEKERILDNYEVTLLEMKRNIEDLDRRVKESSVEKTKELEKLLKECDRRILMFDNKIKEGQGLNSILEKTFDKVSEVKVEAKPSFHMDIEDEEYEEDYEEEFVEDEEYDEVAEVDLEEILELYKSGKSLNEISEITGRSLEDIAVIMGM